MADYPFVQQRERMEKLPDTKRLSSPTGYMNSELTKRIVSGAALAIASLFLSIWSPMTFFALVALGAGFMCWEWRKIISADVQGRNFKLSLGVHLVAVLGAVLLMQMGLVKVALALLPLGGMMLMVLSGKTIRKLSFVGPFYTGLPALALIWLRSDADYGLKAVLFIFLVVWMADIAAYAIGRTIGGPKLSPGISPNKTWSGAIGGLSGGVLVGVLTAYYLGNSSITLLAGVALILAVASQIGDLYESSLKRRFGIKDSSNLIPGHGGILDRVDGLIAAAVLAAIIALFVNPELPGHAILIW